MEKLYEEIKKTAKSVTDIQDNITDIDNKENDPLDVEKPSARNTKIKSLNTLGGGGDTTNSEKKAKLQARLKALQKAKEGSVDVTKFETLNNTVQTYITGIKELISFMKKTQIISGFIE